jgi:predicted DNA-binding transcriptional regulator AlpA
VAGGDEVHPVRKGQRPAGLPGSLEMQARLGISKATLYRWDASGLIPARVVLGSYSGWLLNEIEEWERADKVAAAAALAPLPRLVADAVSGRFRHRSGNKLQICGMPPMAATGCHRPHSCPMVRVSPPAVAAPRRWLAISNVCQVLELIFWNRLENIRQFCDQRSGVACIVQHCFALCLKSEADLLHVNIVVTSRRAGTA